MSTTSEDLKAETYSVPTPGTSAHITFNIHESSALYITCRSVHCWIYESLPVKCKLKSRNQNREFSHEKQRCVD